MRGGRTTNPIISNGYWMGTQMNRNVLFTVDVFLNFASVISKATQIQLMTRKMRTLESVCFLLFILLRQGKQK